MTENGSSGSRPKVLVAGIGNIFFGDDGFGCEVARRMLGRAWPAGVRVADYGIRGIDLAFELLDAYDKVILVDAVQRGGAPGTVYTIEPDLSAMGSGSLEAHGMHPERVLQAAKGMGATLGRIIVVGCEPMPATADPEGPGSMGLSPPVAEAVERAIPIIERLLSA